VQRETEKMIMEEQVSFFSEQLMIEGSLSYDQNLSRGPGVILCSPHPHLGGDMDNNVITALHQFLSARGFISLRFNYRGVGNSQTSERSRKEDLKTFWEESWSPEDEMIVQDVISAIDFLKGIPGVMHSHLFLVGYSFGAYLASRTIEKEPALKALILIAPTIHFHDFSSLATSSIAKYVVSSDNDFSYSLEEFEKIYAAFSPPKELQIYEGADHFFIGREEELSSTVATFMVDHLKEDTTSG